MASKDVHISAIKALQKELNDLNSSPVEGFKVDLNTVENMFTWNVAIFGPPMTLYEGGYFKARIFFPRDYPYNPPSVQFLSKMYHPNIYENGEVCISILHSPGEDPQSGELASERWNPTQSVRTVLLSVISLLNEPNIHSPAHVDASITYRRWVESKDKGYEKIVRELVERTHADAERDGVVVPTTVAEYCISGRPASKGSLTHTGNSDSDLDDDDAFYAFDVDYDDDDEGDLIDSDDDAAPKSGGHVADASGCHGDGVTSMGGATSKTAYCGPDGADSAMEETEAELQASGSSNSDKPIIPRHKSASTSQPGTTAAP